MLPFLAGVLTAATGYSVLQTRLAHDTETVAASLLASRLEVESVLPASLQSSVSCRRRRRPCPARHAGN
ncbi:hypothetical protein BC831DRAFT_442786 [Entophlyctis helioformis]|nr:hypothetical protein BC831DRAFT_442786 [Entophlyctis helioformis]